MTTSPPKPWEIRRQQNVSTTNLTSSTSTSNGTSISKPSTLISPVRPYNPYNNSSYSSGYGSSNSPSYGSYGGYGNNYSGYGSSYGSNYGGYGSGYYGSGYSGYGSYDGSRYGGYGSGYGSTYGSRFGNSYGSNYGGYGSGYGINRYNQSPLPPGAPPSPFQGFLEGGYNHMRNFGETVEGFSRFSRLLDANFDAMHGSFASVLRLLDVAGEFFYVMRTFVVARIFYGGLAPFGKFVRWLLFGTDVRKLTQGNTGSVVDFNEYLKTQDESKRKKILPIILLMIGISFVGIPMLFIKFFKMIKPHIPENEIEEKSLEKVWGNNEQDPNKPTSVQAISDFRGQGEMELSFNKDDVFVVLSKPYPEWWEGEFKGRRGLFPVNFVRPLQSTPPIDISQDDSNR